MDHRTTRALILIGLPLLGGCTCGGPDFDLPEPPPEDRAAPEGPRDPRVPPGFDLAIPEGATVRYGEATAERATVLATTDEDPGVVLRAVRRDLEQRGLAVRDRDGDDAPPGRFREAIEAREGEAVVASAIVERGAAEITRVHLSRRLARGRPFHAPEEPREWRAVTRAPLPAVPGPSETACNAAIIAECEAWARAGGPDALDCALDHRSACGRIADATAAAGFAEDARERLVEALRAHAIVGSRGARAYTLGQLRVELLGARANLVRASAAGAEAPALAALVAATEAEGVRLDVETSFWFNPDEAVDGPAEIPEELAP